MLSLDFGQFLKQMNRSPLDFRGAGLLWRSAARRVHLQLQLSTRCNCPPEHRGDYNCPQEPFAASPQRFLGSFQALFSRFHRFVKVNSHVRTAARTPREPSGSGAVARPSRTTRSTAGACRISQPGAAESLLRLWLSFCACAEAP